MKLHIVLINFSKNMQFLLNQFKLIPTTLLKCIECIKKLSILSSKIVVKNIKNLFRTIRNSFFFENFFKTVKKLFKIFVMKYSAAIHNICCSYLFPVIYMSFSEIITRVYDDIKEILG